MKKTPRNIALLILFSSVIFMVAFNQKTPSEKLLRHVVIFKFNEKSSPEDVQKVASTFAALKGKVPQIIDLEWGINNSPEHFNEGFTHCFMLSFKSEKDLADYQNNPNHKAFQEVLKPHMEKVFVVDYWVK